MNNSGYQSGDKMALNLPGLSKSYSLVEFIPRDAPENLWTAYFTLSETIFREFNQRGRLPNREAARRLFLAPNPLYTVKRWVVFNEAEGAIASASLSYDTELSPDYESSKHICQIYISVVSAYRRKKIATYSLKHMIETARFMEKDTVRADVENSTGLDFCKYLRGELIHQEVQHRLYMEDVDWQLADKSLEKGRTKSRSTKIELFQECPESDIDEFSGIYTEIINQRPIGDLEQELITTPDSRRIEERNLKRRGIEWYTMISRGHDGQISGMTDIMYNPEEPYRIHQYFTGVLGRYRGRGLAKRLKLEMLMFIKEKFPDVEYITTSTAKENIPMRAINKQLGFMPQKTCFMFRWTLRDLGRQVDEILSGLDYS
jgi:RimJ/RimL family protein N-acetyltransferase